MFCERGPEAVQTGTVLELLVSSAHCRKTPEDVQSGTNCLALEWLV